MQIDSFLNHTKRQYVPNLYRSLNANVMKTKLFFTAILISTHFFGQIPTASLDSEYKFNAASLVDTYGTPENFTQTGTSALFTTDRFAVNSNAINLAGDYLQRVPLQNSTTLSMSFWIKTTTNDAEYRTIMDQSQRSSVSNTTGQRGWYVYLRNGIVRLSCNYQYNYQPTGANTITGNSGYLDCSSNTNIADNNWHHVVITLKGRVYWWQNSYWMYENEYKIYVDNVLKNTVPHSYNTYKASGWFGDLNFLPNNNVVVGNNSLTNLATISRYADQIDDIRFYKAVLTATDISNLYNESAQLTTEDFTFSDFSVYPNPFKDILSIESTENIEQLELYSMEGRSIKKVNSSSIEVSDLSSGMYFVKLKTETGKLGVKKILKK